MYFPTFAVAILMANVITASVIHSRQDAVPQCAEPAPSEEFLEFSKSLKASASSLTSRQEQKRYNFRVFAHVVYFAQNSKGGFVSEDAIKRDIDTMNKHYSRSGVSFTHAKTNYVNNRAWATGEDDMGMKRQLRQGGYADLNLYYTAYIPGEVTGGGPPAGFCYFPIVPHGNSVREEDLVRDGCVMLAQTVPGADGWFGQDMTTTHEVGHWLGLQHTFQGGCGAGDTIGDTAPQEGPTGHCENQYKFDDGRPAAWTCGGWQPSNMLNFMDYSSCSSEFTLGQEERMRQWAELRQKIGGSPTPGQDPATNPNPNPNPNSNPTPTPTPTPNPDPTPDNDDSHVATIWTQCGGRTWTGPTACAEGLICRQFGAWYSQCQPAA